MISSQHPARAYPGQRPTLPMGGRFCKVSAFTYHGFCCADVAMNTVTNAHPGSGATLCCEMCT